MNRQRHVQSHGGSIERIVHRMAEPFRQTDRGNHPADHLQILDAAFKFVGCRCDILYRQQRHAPEPLWLLGEIFAVKIVVVTARHHRRPLDVFDMRHGKTHGRIEHRTGHAGGIRETSAIFPNKALGPAPCACCAASRRAMETARSARAAPRRAAANSGAIRRRFPSHGRRHRSVHNSRSSKLPFTYPTAICRTLR